MLEPVQSILKAKLGTLEIDVECPPSLMVETDQLRLRQIVLNLAMNSSKYVEKGYIRIRAEMLDGFVRLLVEDSGPGIPVEKRGRLFAQFRESLDLQDQGAGICICLANQLARLIDGEVFLDDSVFDSGIEGCPGSRFVVDLKRPPISQRPRGNDAIH